MIDAIDALRARHWAAPLSPDELDALPADELRVLALDEAIAGPDRLGDPLPPAIAAERRR